MKPEQQKQLKPGDEIFIRSTFIKTDNSGDIVFTVNFRCAGIVDATSYSVPENVFLRSDLQQPAEKPKYDPCRRLKKGDKVKPCSWRNRIPSARLGATRIIPDTRVLEVMSDELHEHVSLIYGDEVIQMHICFLELVTPVEEMEPYYVKDDGTHYVVGKRPEEPEIVYLAEYSKSRHPHAKAAAEAERDRLNAEHRKEHPHGNQ